MSETLELCFKCDEPTGCAGKADDSWYNEDNEGPFCWRCWCEDQFPKVAEEIEKKESQISTLEEKAEESKQVVAHYQSTVDGLLEKVKEVKIGNMEAPPYDDTDITTGEKRTDITPEIAYLMGYHTGIIVCGEVLSKPIDLPTAEDRHNG